MTRARPVGQRSHVLHAAAGGPGLVEQRVTVPESIPAMELYGPGDANLHAVEEGFGGIEVSARGSEVVVAGEPGPVGLATQLIVEFIDLIDSGTDLTRGLIDRSIEMLARATAPRAARLAADAIVMARGRAIAPKTRGQREYVEAIDEHTVTFGIGPAGTGKTYLAVAKAVQALQSRLVNRIVLTRPAVEAGERLGYLPGSLSEKIDPYLRPLYDAMRDLLDSEPVSTLLEEGTIEVAPLAYMRGRTLNDAFIILDEAQNTSSEQMKMFLTRLGFNSKMVITGDETQVDLPGGTASGLQTIEQVLAGIEDVQFCRLSSSDVVRNRLVSDIVEAYDRWDATRAGAGRGRAVGAGRRDQRGRRA